MTLDYNQQRGQALFESKIQTSGLSNEEQIVLNALKKHFMDQVGVMPTGGLLAAARIAQACINAVKEDAQADFASMAMRALVLYGELNHVKTVEPVLNDEQIKQHNAITDALFKELNANSVSDNGDNVAKVLTKDKNGNIQERTLIMDDIDMLDDIENEDLSIEGKRRLGMISKDYDTLSGDAVVETNTRSTLPFGTIVALDNGEWEILSPFTNTSDVYPVGDGIYCCLATDKKFRIDLNLADLQATANKQKFTQKSSEILLPPIRVRKKF